MDTKNLLKDSKAYYEDNDYYEIFSIAEDGENKVGAYLEEICKDKIVLDAGCGTGKFLNILEEYTKKYIGIDLSAKQLEKAKTKSKKDTSEFICSNLSNINLESDKVDLIVCSWVLGTIIDITERNKCLSELKRLLKSNGTIILIENDGNSVWDLLREDKVKELRESNPPHVFIKILEKLLTQAIKEYKKYNLVKSQEYSERLRNLLKQYNNRPEIGGDDNSEIEMTIVGLMAFSQEMIEEEDKANKNHLKGRERAFYDALTTDSKAVQLMTDETLRLIAMKLKDVVEKYATVDWSKKKSTQAEMRSQIKRLLDAYGYPPEYNEEATARVISQAEYMM